MLTILNIFQNTCTISHKQGRRDGGGAGAGKYLGPDWLGGPENLVKRLVTV